MLYTGVQSGSQPHKVTVEHLPDETSNIRLTDNIEEVMSEEGTTYKYDEVVFMLPKERHATEENILKDFDDWWAFGSQPEEPPITLEDRVSVLEDLIMDILG